MRMVHVWLALNSVANSSVCNFRKFGLWKFPQKFCREFYVSDMKYCRFAQRETGAWFQTSAALSKRSAPFWDFTQRRVVVCGRCYGTTSWSHFQGSKNSWTAGQLMLGLIGSIEISVTIILGCVRSKEGGFRKTGSLTLRLLMSYIYIYIWSS